MNNVFLVGRWVADLELAQTPQGKAVTQGRLAVAKSFKREGQPDADFLNIILWGKNAENAVKYTKKGDRIGIAGRIETRNYENKEGQRVYLTEIVANEISFLQDRTDNNGVSQAQAEASVFSDKPVIDISDEDLDMIM